MKRLTQELKNALSAMAVADAGEMLSRRQMRRHLSGTPARPTSEPVKSVPSISSRPQVGLYLGAGLPEAVLRYALQTCKRLDAGLTVLSLVSREEARSLMEPFRAELEAEKVECQIDTLQGDTRRGLVRYLRANPKLMFLVCNEAGHLARGFLLNPQGWSDLPVPVVVVTKEDANAMSGKKPSQPARKPAASAKADGRDMNLGGLALGGAA